MARDRVFINSEYRAFLDSIKEKDILGLNESIVDTKDIFLLAVALGINSPADTLKSRDGYFRMQYLKTTDKALLASVLLNTVVEDDDIDNCANLDKSLDLCELCAESGFEILRTKVNDANCDSDLLERRMLKELDLLYTKQIENSI